MNGDTHGILRTQCLVLLYVFVDRNQCGSAPCLHGGECVELSNTYICRCPEGYSGKQCERGEIPRIKNRVRYTNTGSVVGVMLIVPCNLQEKEYDVA